MVPAGLPISPLDLDSVLRALQMPLDRAGELDFLVSAERHVTSDQFPPLGHIIANTSAKVAGTTQTEDMVHAFLGPIFEDPLLIMFNWLGDDRWTVNRNAREPDRCTSTTRPTSRPDWQLFHQGNVRKMLFRGEEKRASGDIEQARAELLEKFETWSPILFGDAPYVLAYACAGAEMQLYAIHRTGLPTEPAAALFSIGDRLRLARLQDRLKLVKYLFNLVRVLQAIAASMPSDGLMSIGEYARVNTGENPTIYFERTHVRKTLIDTAEVKHPDAVLLQELYEEVRRGNIVRTVKCDPGYPKYEVVGNRSRLVLHLRPVGQARRPRTPAELRAALEAVLQALRSMHRRGFVHRDVRWPNIVILTDQSWMLIDLDFAARLDGDGRAPWPTWQRGVPRRSAPDAPWSPAFDVKQVAMLLDDLPRDRDGLESGMTPDALALMRTALAKETADAALVALVALAAPAAPAPAPAVDREGASPPKRARLAP